jgi:uncharacterized protein YfaS (alpha-2-macroglobulin family)
MLPHPTSARLRALIAWNLVVILLVALVVTFERHGEVSEGVRLRLTTAEFNSSTRLDLLFDEDIVGADAVGGVAVESPLVVEPMLKGSFVWLSPREGVYAHDEIPRMGTTYRYRLATGLRNARGELVPARLSRSFTTPDFDIANVRTRFASFDGNWGQPEIHVAFNANVSPAEIATYCEFRSGVVSRPAEVIRFSGAELPGHKIDGNPGLKSSQVPAAWKEVPKAQSDTAGNAVGIRPRFALPPGTDWQLVLKKGLPAQTDGMVLRSDRTVKIGRIVGMSVTEMAAVNSYTSPKSIEVRFTRHPAWPSHGNLTDWVSVEPSPADLQMELRYRAIALSGAFETGRNYRVTARTGLESRAGESLLEEVTENVRFEPLPPRVVLSTADDTRWGKGRGVLDFLAFNTRRVRVRVKRLDPATLVQTMAGYRLRMRNGEAERDYPFDLVPGKTLATRYLPIRTDGDKAVRASLDLGLLAGGGGGPLFIDLQPVETGNRVGAQTIVQMTDLGLQWKQGRDGTTVHVFSLTDSRAVAGAEVRLSGAGDEVISRGRTDGLGRLVLKGAEKARWITATQGEDVVAYAMNEGELVRYGFGLPVAWRLPEPEARILMFTDRPVYEPGALVRLKGIARIQDDGLQLPPEAEPVVLTLFDSRGTAVQRTNLNLSSSGSFDWTFPAPEKHRGHCQISAGIGPHEERVSVLVEDHEPDAFEVTLGGKDVFGPGDAVHMPVAARYLFGTALSDAEVKWVAEATEGRFESAAFPDFIFGEHVGIQELERQGQRSQWRGRGRIVPGKGIELELTLPRAGNPRTVNLEVEVTDLNGQTIAGRRSIVSHGADRYLGCRLPDEGPKVGEQAMLKVVAAAHNGSVVSDPIDIGIRLDKLVWRANRVGGAGGTVDYRNELKLLEIVQTNLIAKGVTDFQMPAIPEPGQYLITLNAIDGAGQPIETRTLLEAAGHEAVVWNYRNAAQIDLTPDRDRYKPGDVAELIVKSPIGGTAYVTVERDRVHHSFTTNLSGGAPVIQIPIRREDAPNVFVSVTVVRGAGASRRQDAEPEFRYGYAQLKVQDEVNELGVKVLPDQAAYRPGEPVKVTCLVTNHRGRPQRSAEVTLYAVDEGVLRLTGSSAPDARAFFHQERPLSVRTHLSLVELLPEDPADLRFHNKGYLIGGGGHESERGRERFADCPLWQASLKTDRRGRVTAEFKAPDNLTRYRLVAVVHAGAERFGHGEGSIEVSKPLVVEPVFPNFARVGDRMVLRAMVVNRTKNSEEVEVTRRSSEGPKERQTIFVGAGEAKAVDYPSTFTEEGFAEWTWEAAFVRGRTTDEKDVVTRRLAVLDAMPMRSQVDVGRVAGSTNLLATLDRTLLEQGARATLTVTTLPLLEARAGLRHLLHYPYGCVEQTSSSLLPWLSLSKAPGLHRLIGPSGIEADIAIAAGVERLFSMQTGDGGLSYWPGAGQSMFWGSAYAAFVLSQAPGRPERQWQALLEYLRDQLQAVEPLANPVIDEAQAMALCALAFGGTPLPALHQRAHERRAALGAETRALVALAEMAGGGRRELARDLLVGGREPKDAGRHFGSTARRLAIEAIAWGEIDRVEGDAKRELLLAERRNGQWATTQGNAWALMALVSAGGKATSGAAEGRWQLGEARGTFALKGGELFEKASDLDPDAAGVARLELDAGAPVYAELRVEAPVSKNAKPEMKRGYEVVRSYERLNGPGPWRVGDSARVTVVVKVGKAAEYVAIDDSLPAVFEAIVGGFESRGVAGETDSSTNDFVSHRELRNDRALFFCDRLPAGEHRFEYLARVRAAGQAYAPPVKVEEMYAPHRYGTSRGETVEAGL